MYRIRVRTCQVSEAVSRYEMVLYRYYKFIEINEG